MRISWVSALLVGVIVYVALKLLPANIIGKDHALAAAVIAFLASVVIRGMPARWGRW
jgi:uncharacterized membrane protein (UPF0136 family)